MPDPLEPGVCVADPRIAAQTHGNPHVSAGISVDPQGRQRPLTVPKTARKRALFATLILAGQGWSPHH